MTKSDLIIFDCDGVLVDSEMLSCRCLSEVLAGYGIILGLDQALDLFLGRSVTAVCRALRSIGTLDSRSSSPAELKSGVRAAFQSALRPIEGVSSVLEDLHIPHCVASSSDVDRVSFSLSLTGLAPHFDTALHLANGGTRQARARPLPLCSRTDAADPRRTLVIEDSVSGVKAAKAAGMTVWGFVGGSHYQSRDGKAILHEAGADRVFGRMADFWRTER